MKRMLALLLVAVVLLAGCGQQREEDDLVITLRQQADGLLVDEVFGYSVQVPADWTYYTAAELQELRQQETAGRESYNMGQRQAASLVIPVESTSARQGEQYSMGYSVGVSITYTRIERSIETVAQEAYEQAWETLENHIFDQERSTVGRPEALVLDGVTCYRYRMDLKGVEEQEYWDMTVVNYLIPLSDAVMEGLSVTVGEDDAVLLEQLEEMLHTWRWNE